MVLAADGGGGLTRIDPRKKSRQSSTMACHERKINTVHLEPLGRKSVATSGTDGKVRLWDVRRFDTTAKPIASLEVGKSCQCALFSPDGSASLVTISFDDRIHFWHAKGKNYSVQASLRHNNQTGRWLMPLRPTWAPDGRAVVVGSMRRETELIDPRDGKHLAQLQSEFQTAVASRHACHPSLPLIAAGTASGRIHVWRGQPSS